MYIAAQDICYSATNRECKMPVHDLGTNTEV